MGQLLCLLRFPASAQLQLHSLQEKGFSPVCVKMCLFCAGVVALFATECLRMCCLRSKACEKDYTLCIRKAFLLNESTCAFSDLWWQRQSNCTECKQTAFHHCESAFGFSAFATFRSCSCIRCRDFFPLFRSFLECFAKLTASVSMTFFNYQGSFLLVRARLLEN